MNQNFRSIEELLNQDGNDPQDKERFLKAFAELDEQWNRDRNELELEASLEKVRVIALSMNQPADMPEICRRIALELIHLGVKEIRNVQTAIFYVERGTYMNYEYYVKHNKTVITETVYTNHPIAQAFADEMLKGKGEVFQTDISASELPAWYAYQKTTNVFIDTFLETAPSLTYYWYSLGPVALGISTYIPLSEKDIELFKRFRNVFELAYRRYLDIELAISQAREARTETALERVRAVAMAMRKPDELLEICKTVFSELKELGFAELRNAMINIHHDEKKYFLNYDYSDFAGAAVARLPYDLYPSLEILVNQSRNSTNAFIEYVYTGKELVDWKFFRKKSGEYDDPRVENIDALYYYFYSIGVGSIGISTFAAIGEEQLDLLKRFRNVFNLSYQRYSDITLAESQAREAKIEAALEKVRSRSLAMHRSDELQEVVNTVFERLRTLDIDLNVSSIFIFEEGSKDWQQWVATATTHYSSYFHIPYMDHPIFNDIEEARQTGNGFYAKRYSREQKNEWFNYAFKNTEYSRIPDDRKQFILDSEFFQVSFAFAKNTAIQLAKYSGDAFSEKENEILTRFSYVFEQAYTRFLDLKKAEAQTRESQIQLAMERVRARTMAMQHSDELPEAAALLFQQVQGLGMPAWSAGYCIWDDDKMGITLCMSSEGVLQKPFRAPLTEDPSFIHIREHYLRNERFYTEALGGNELVKHYQYMRKLPVVGEILDSIIDAGHPLPTFQIFHVVYFSQGLLLFITYEPVPEAHDTFKRFGNVFDQTYTRFLDLKKAEAQAREAQIETALEKVRSRSLAMHKSEEIKEVVTTVFDKITELGIEMNGGVSIVTFLPGSKDYLHWLLLNGEFLNVHLSYFNHKIFNDCNNAREKGMELFASVYSGEEKQVYFKYLLENTGFSKSPEELKSWVLQQPWFGFSFAIQKNSGIFLNDYTGKYFSKETNDILIRFSRVFEQSYIRFLDLKKAEGQAREARIEAAMEKVRSKAMAMQKPSELVDVAQLLRSEMGLLGVEELETSSIYTHHESTGLTDCWYAIQDQKEKKLVSDHMSLDLSKTAVGRQMLDFYHSSKTTISIPMKGEDRKEWINYCAAHSRVLVGYYGDSIPDRTYYLYKFSNGYLGAASPGAISTESWDLLKRATAVFSLAYTRFNDLKIAEAHAIQAEEDLVKLQAEKKRAEDALVELRAAQKQLVQSEKMASLGELTAGIAHEIQNPLNFVNNFSEVSSELIDEMVAAVGKGDVEEASAIAGDLKQNLEKINHHGKRADSIVKGMLQHSRTSTGQKEPTDINALCDEYIRLCYHGIRARDSNFNATIQTDFDPTAGSINVVPQEMGRVVLNLLTNAFYAVNERMKLHIPSYQPTVFIRTKKTGNKIFIEVKDNGNGIPQNVIDKIFQPFFTTKPTGQGTGLGLSLSYDIIKAHGGDISVETREGEGSTFTINLN